jgi:D-alanine-D-alanine ligase
MPKKQTKKKLRVGILFGGRSGEHEISLRSASSILNAIDKTKYEVVPIAITKQGQWLTANEATRLLAGDTKPTPVLLKSPKSKSIQLAASAELVQQDSPLAQSLDVIFPVLHGTFGEDGTIQGLLELADIAYVGSGVLGSATGMDKSAMKQLFAAAGLPQTPHVNLLRTEWKADPKRCTKLIEKNLTYPVFVKPANLGSSVGISKVHKRSELGPAMDLAAGYDRKLIIEQGVGGQGVKPRELEVAVLGNDTPEASVVGEIVPGAEFYDYDAKYNSDSSIPIIPAQLSRSESDQIRKMAIAAFRACDCAGLARVDFLMEPKSKIKKKKKSKPPRIYLNEINTMPGFTSISMYPKLWEATGIHYAQLIDRLITLADERHREKQETTFTRV